ncbi:right-handed parallel beta-helix repeat-containing protein [Thalassotalea crassostreae]|uniref:CBM96 family carbohydrate-binding protein n=1 Tax=Thalassotalea crassostreae TaxID=1763536 RepID=UPI000837D6EB|nr:right-handed parallel beta-helix repeat-containing protein [Thalassotalea crassostreae]
MLNRYKSFLYSFASERKGCLLTILPAFFMLQFSINVQAADIFVANSGDDSKTGSIEQPLATIQQALNIAAPGDTIYLREGRYHEYVDFSGVSGLPGQPITISNYNGEIAVIDGSRLLADIGGEVWTPLTDAGHPNCANHCYKTTLDKSLIDAFDGATDSEDGSKVKGIWQLWVNDSNADGNYKMMIPARWPNYDRGTGHPTKEIKFKSDNRTPIDNSWWDMGGTWGFMKNSWVAQKSADYDSSVLTSKDLGYNLHHLENNPVYHDLAALPAQDQGGNELNLSGGSLILNYHSETQFSRPIEANGHSAGSNTITHRSVVDPHDQNVGYFLVEHKNALDQPGEWYFDANTNEVWLWPEDEQNPTGKDIRGKTQSWAMDLNGSDHITLKGLQFFGTTIKCENECDYLTIENSQFMYPSWYPRMLGLHSYKGEDNLTKGDKAGSDAGEGAMILDGSHIQIRNNEFAHSDAMIKLDGSSGCSMRDNHVVNNLFHHFSYTGLAQMMVFMNSNCDSTFTRNTMHTNGSKVMVKHALVDISWSHVSSFGYFQQDGTAFQCKGGNFEQGASNGTERHHIWAVDALKGLGRWDGNDGVGGIDHHQVAMNVAAHGNIKGDFHTVSNNTTVFPHQSSKTMFKISSTTWVDNDGIDGKGDGEPDVDENGLIHPEENENSYVYNNLSSGLSSDPHLAVPLLVKPENMAANWNGFGIVSTKPNLDTTKGDITRGEFTPRSASDTAASRLRDPENFDFRPKATATEIIDQGIPVSIPVINMNGTAVPNVGLAINSQLTLDDPIAGVAQDLGAYEYDSANALEYWIPGYRYQTLASSPVPRLHTQSAKVEADLMWLPAQGAVGHIVYLGTDKNQLSEICRYEGDDAVAQGKDINNLPALEEGFTHLKNICSPPELAANSNYFWRVDTILTDNQIETGAVWDFTVAIPAEEVTTVLEPSADTYIDEGSAANSFADAEGLKLCTPDADSSSSLRVAYFKFDLANIEGSIKKATLRVRRNNQAGTSNETGAYIVSNTAAIDSLTYNDAVDDGLIPVEGVDNEIAFVDKIYEGSWGDFDITEGLVANQNEIVIALKAHASSGCGNKKLIDSMEAEQAANEEIGPELIIVSQEQIGDPAPQSVKNLIARNGLRSVTLNWSVVTENDVIGYNVYRRDHHEDEYKFPLNNEPLAITDAWFTDTTLTAGQSYEYVVRAIDEAEQESNNTQIQDVGLADSDSDNMSDSWEAFYGLEVGSNDSSDDLDTDTVTNIAEYNQGSNPNDDNSTDATPADTDNDGMSDDWEVTYDLDPRVNDANADADEDNVSNIEEYLAGTNPRAKDSSNSEPIDPTDPTDSTDPDDNTDDSDNDGSGDNSDNDNSDSDNTDNSDEQPVAEKEESGSGGSVGITCLMFLLSIRFFKTYKVTTATKQ